MDDRNASKGLIPKAVSGIGLAGCLLTLSLTAQASSQIEGSCIQEAAGFNVQCSANDIQIAGVATNPDGSPQLDILDDGCAYQGDTVEFTATFELVSSAKERHDIGIYFVTDGDPQQDGAISGSCNISTLPYQPDPPWLDLDGLLDPYPGTSGPSGVQDTCGDIDKPGHNPLFPTITITAVCTDPDNDGALNLPYCTSWRQSGANELCTSPVDAFPGSPSKCKCDDGFNVPIDVPPAELLVSKSAAPTELTEPGGNVTFSVSVTNVGVDPNNPVTLSTLSDDIYGDITQAGQNDIVSTTCAVPQSIPSDDRNPGGIDTYSCQFTVALTGNADDVETDTVTATGTDTHGNVLTGSDTATVTLLDSLPALEVVKTAQPTQLLEPGGPVDFTLTVQNTSLASSDPVSLTDLVDNVYGDLNGLGTCQTGILLNPSDSYSCGFTATVAGNSGYIETDTITVTGTDDEGNPVSSSDSATVVINNVPSDIALTKTASPEVLSEPGGNVTYTYRITNLSTVDTVTVNTLDDDILGNLDGQGSCSVPQVLAPQAEYSCTVTTYVASDANTSVTNVATAGGLDDDGEPVLATDDATVNLDNVPPAASVTKTATMALVTFEVTVTNDSDAEPLTVTQLTDDVFGDITFASGNIQSTTCSVPQLLQPATQAGDQYSCTFEAWVDTANHTNTVTATVEDNDGSTPAQPQDSATVTLQ